MRWAGFCKQDTAIPYFDQRFVSRNRENPAKGILGYSTSLRHTSISPIETSSKTYGYKFLNNIISPFCVTLLLQAAKRSINTSRNSFTAHMETNRCATFSAWEGVSTGSGEQARLGMWLVNLEEGNKQDPYPSLKQAVMCF